jgi:hypothetical protein
MTDFFCSWSSDSRHTCRRSTAAAVQQCDPLGRLVFFGSPRSYMLFVDRRKCPILHTDSVILLHDNAWLYTVHNTEDWELSSIGKWTIHRTIWIWHQAIFICFLTWWITSTSTWLMQTGIYLLCIQDEQTYHTLANVTFFIPQIIHTINHTGTFTPLHLGSPEDGTSVPKHVGVI